MKRYCWKLNKIYNKKEFNFAVKALLATKIIKKNINEYNRQILKYFTFCNMQLMINKNNKFYLKQKERLIDFYNKINNFKQESIYVNNYIKNNNYICFYKNKQIKYNDSTFSAFMNNKNRNIRRVVYNEYLNNIYINKDCLLEQLIKFKEKNSTSNLNSNLIDIVVKDLNYAKPLFNKYIKMKSKILNIKHFTFYDLYKSIDNKKYKFKIKDIFTSLYPILSKHQLKEIKKDKILDLYPKRNKQNGYLTISHYDLEPHILINYNGSFKDLLMVSHELGHYYVYKERKNVCTYNEYKFDDLEIPSIVNEFIYIYNNLRKNNDRKIIISNFLDNLLNEFYRYGIYSIFEDKIHKIIKYKNKPDTLSEIYLNLLKFYYPNVYILKNQKYEFLKLKQLYKNNYCVKYPIAVIISYSIAYKIVTKEDYINKYKKFIYSNIKFSYENIKNYLDVDIFSTKTHTDFIEKIKDLINELELLLKED